MRFESPFRLTRAPDMSRHFTLFAQSFLGGTLDWITSGVKETMSFVQEWVVASFNARIFGVITAIVVLFAIVARVSNADDKEHWTRSTGFFANASTPWRGSFQEACH